MGPDSPQGKTGLVNFSITAFQHYCFSTASIGVATYGRQSLKRKLKLKKEAGRGQANDKQQYPRYTKHKIQVMAQGQELEQCYTEKPESAKSEARRFKYTN